MNIEHKNILNSLSYHTDIQFSLSKFIIKQLHIYNKCNNIRNTIYKVLYKKKYYDTINIINIYGPELLDKYFVKELDNLLQYNPLIRFYPCNKKCDSDYIIYNDDKHLHYEKDNVSFIFTLTTGISFDPYIIKILKANYDNE